MELNDSRFHVYGRDENYGLAYSLNCLLYTSIEKVRDPAYWGNNLLDGKEYLVQAKLNNRVSASACNRLYKLSFLRQRGLNFKSGIVYEDLLFNFQCMIQGYVYKRQETDGRCAGSLGRRIHIPLYPD